MRTERDRNCATPTCLSNSRPAPTSRWHIVPGKAPLRVAAYVSGCSAELASATSSCWMVAGATTCRYGRPAMPRSASLWRVAPCGTAAAATSSPGGGGLGTYRRIRGRLRVIEVGSTRDAERQFGRRRSLRAEVSIQQSTANRTPSRCARESKQGAPTSGARRRGADVRVRRHRPPARRRRRP
jgi:hypothetical protein